MAQGPESLVVLQDCQCVRLRPGMYLPAEPSDALTAAVQGAMCLSLEAVALGRAPAVRLVVQGPLALTVSDDGRFPALLEPADAPLGERLLTELLSCRALKPEELHTLCAVPIVVPAALARRASLSVDVDGLRRTLTLVDGRVVRGFTDDGPAGADGVHVAFELDGAFFPGVTLDDDVVAAALAAAHATVPCARVEVGRGAGDRESARP